MAISKESKQAIKNLIESLSVQKKIASRSLQKLEKEVYNLTARINEIDSTITKLEADLNG